MSTPQFFDGHDGLLCDLDGVVYAGSEALPGAVESLTALIEAGIPVAFVTNNASRSPQTVADHLVGLGVPTDADHVFGSAQAGVALLAEHVSEGACVLPVGSEYLTGLLEESGFRVAASASDRPDAVIQGFDSSVGWSDLAEAAYAVNSGAVWVATNLDLSIPRGEGIAPGNGALVGAVAHATGTSPVAAGKPEPYLFQTAARALVLQSPLVVGDRLDTDIRGGNAAGFDTVMVLTGIDSRSAAEQAPDADRPRWIVDDLTALSASIDR